ncbi:MFS transporter [Paenibacillus sp. Leaf72]|uniref:MFS transporter n=1 Tax=Paenibacillus sp. Leaf72 TaxID=1736234 RepID=UPI0006F5D78C|nr:MFS transporter [Paenibacillus sp. Leaf72]KQO04673.1 tetracycline resistance protein TetA [Paenibacillus sp. Leaf72]
MSTNEANQPVTQKMEAALPKEGLIIFLVGFAVVLVIMNTAMFNLAISDLSHFFELPLSTISLAITGYSIMFAIASITYSRLSDFVPIHLLFTTSLVTTGLASIVGFFSHHFWVLLIARIMQAAGAGAIISLSIVLLTRYVPIKRRGKTMSIIMSSVSLGLGLGPITGGFVVEFLGWQYLFAISSLTLILVPLLFRLIPKERFVKGKFDVQGACYISIGTAGILLFLTNQSWSSLCIGLLGLVLFVFRLLRTPKPFVQPSLFINKTYISLSLIGILAYLCNFSSLYLLPQVLINHFNLSASQAGFVIFPGALLSMLASRKIGAIIDRNGNSSILRFVPILILAATCLFAIIGVRFWIANIFVFLLMNLGFTMLGSSVSNEISRILPPSEISSGIGLYQLLQFLSGAFGIAGVSSALRWQHNYSFPIAYANIFWGLFIFALLTNCFSYFYRKLTISS